MCTCQNLTCAKAQARPSQLVVVLVEPKYTKTLERSSMWTFRLLVVVNKHTIPKNPHSPSGKTLVAKTQFTTPLKQHVKTICIKAPPEMMVNHIDKFAEATFYSACSQNLECKPSTETHLDIAGIKALPERIDDGPYWQYVADATCCFRC